MATPLILFEDNHLLVVVKPVGLLSQSDRTGQPDLQSELKKYLSVRDDKPGDAFLALVQRLDRMVGGLMVLAKTSKAAQRLNRAFVNQQVEKYYLALVHGRLVDGPEVWQNRLTRGQKGGRYRVTEEPSGRPATLIATALASDQESTLLAIRLLTGRSHQIRVQAMSRGHALLGDRRYGPMTDSDLSLASPALYACRLALPHPVADRRLVFTLPPPIGMAFDRFPTCLDEAYLQQTLDTFAEEAAVLLESTL